MPVEDEGPPPSAAEKSLFFDGPGTRRTGRVIFDVITINEIPEMREENIQYRDGTHRREGCAMIAVEHDEAVSLMVSSLRDERSMAI